MSFRGAAWSGTPFAGASEGTSFPRGSTSFQHASHSQSALKVSAAKDEPIYFLLEAVVALPGMGNARMPGKLADAMEPLTGISKVTSVMRLHTLLPLPNIRLLWVGTCLSMCLRMGGEVHL